MGVTLTYTEEVRLQRQLDIALAPICKGDSRLPNDIDFERWANIVPHNVVRWFLARWLNERTVKCGHAHCEMPAYRLANKIVNQVGQLHHPGLYPLCATHTICQGDCGEIVEHRERCEHGNCDDCWCQECDADQREFERTHGPEL